MSEKPRKSTISVYRTRLFPGCQTWNYRVAAPNASMGSDNWLTISGHGYSTARAAQQVAEDQAKFYDDFERYRVRGVRERRMKRPLKRGERICETCGKPHDCYEIRQGRHRRGDWGDPVDGHSYRAESWESLARRLLAERQAA